MGLIKIYFLNIVYYGGRLLVNDKNAELKKKKSTENVNVDILHRNVFGLIIHSSTSRSDCSWQLLKPYVSTEQYT